MSFLDDILPFRAEKDRERIIDKYKRFLPIARAYAAMSKDPSTKVGSLILGPGFEVRSSGWNGAPRGSRADEDERFQQRPEKYYWASHAESNSIANAARTGTPVHGCTMLVTLPPCMDCAKLIVQSGIERVLFPKAGPEFTERWLEHIGRSRRLFDEVGVEVIEFDPSEG